MTVNVHYSKGKNKMIAIKTQYRGPNKALHARILTTANSRRRYYRYDDKLSELENHQKAARRFADDVLEEPTSLFSGELDSACSVHVFAPEFDHMNRKAYHGCTDAWCAECDGPRPRKRGKTTEEAKRDGAPF